MSDLESKNLQNLGTENSLSRPLPELLKSRPPNRFVSLFLRSALLFVGIVMVAFAVSWSFGWVAFDQLSGEELFQQVMTGRKEIRSVAAMEWVKTLQIHSEQGETERVALLRPSDTQLDAMLWELKNFQQAREPNPPLIAAIASLAGFSEARLFVQQALREFLASLGSDQLPEARIAAMLSLLKMNLALGLKSHDDVKLYVSQVNHPDSSVRKAVAFSLGEFARKQAEPEWVELLVNFLMDPVEDVRWNAAFALARLKDMRALPVVRGLYDRMEQLSAYDLSRSDLMVFEESFRATLELRDESSRKRLEKIASTHPNLKLRQLAKDWVAKAPSFF